MGSEARLRMDFVAWRTLAARSIEDLRVQREEKISWEWSSCWERIWCIGGEGGSGVVDIFWKISRGEFQMEVGSNWSMWKHRCVFCFIGTDVGTLSEPRALDERGLWRVS
jgi:hypothetical protein